MISYDTGLALFDIPHLVGLSPGPSMLLWMALFLSNGWITFHCIYAIPTSHFTLPIVYMYYIHSPVCGHLDFFHKVALTCYLHFLTFSSSLPKQTLVLMNPHEAAGGSQCLPSCQSSVLCLLFLDLLLLFAVTSSWSFWNSPLGKLPTAHAAPFFSPDPSMPVCPRASPQPSPHLCPP